MADRLSGETSSRSFPAFFSSPPCVPCRTHWRASPFPFICRGERQGADRQTCGWRVTGGLFHTEHRQFVAPIVRGLLWRSRGGARELITGIMGVSRRGGGRADTNQPAPVQRHRAQGRGDLYGDCQWRYGHALIVGGRIRISRGLAWLALPVGVVG